MQHHCTNKSHICDLVYLPLSLQDFAICVFSLFRFTCFQPSKTVTLMNTWPFTEPTTTSDVKWDRAKAKILSLTPVWPRGFNTGLSISGTYRCRGRNSASLQAVRSKELNFKMMRSIQRCLCNMLMSCTNHHAAVIVIIIIIYIIRPHRPCYVRGCSLFLPTEQRGLSVYLLVYQWALQKRLNGSRCHLGWGLGWWGQGTMY